MTLSCLSNVIPRLISILHIEQQFFVIKTLEDYHSPIVAIVESWHTTSLWVFVVWCEVAAAPVFVEGAPVMPAPVAAACCAWCLDSYTLPYMVTPRCLKRGFSSNSFSIFDRRSTTNLSDQPPLVKSSCLRSCEHVGLSFGSNLSDHCAQRERERR